MVFGKKKPRESDDIESMNYRLDPRLMKQPDEDESKDEIESMKYRLDPRLMKQSDEDE